MIDHRKSSGPGTQNQKPLFGKFFKPALLGVGIVAVAGLVFSGSGYAGQSQSRQKQVQHRKIANLAQDQDVDTSRQAGLDEIADRLDRIVGKYSSCLKSDNIGIKVISLDTGKTIYDHNGEKLFLPASNMKVVTTAAALDILKPDYRFDTLVAYDGTRKNGVVNGNIYLKGMGDPKLVTENIWHMAREVKRLGITEFTGSMIVDSSYFEQDKVVDDPKNQAAYTAMTGALSLNHNSIEVTVRPGDNVGDKPVVAVDPESEYIKVENNAKTGRNGRNSYTLSINRVGRDGYDIIRVEGSMPVGAAPLVTYRNITNPELYAGESFRGFLAKEGITVRGASVSGLLPPVNGTPSGAKMIYKHQSEPLAVILRDVNKFSNNFMANMLMKAVGAKTAGAPGNIEKGVAAVSTFIGGNGIFTGEYIIADGSGLSRQSRLTPDQLTSLLKFMHGKFDYFAEFASSLAVAGVDRLVAKRLDDMAWNRGVRVKTGTLNGVYNLCGYFQTETGDVLAFAIITNGFHCYYKKSWQLQEDVIREVYEAFSQPQIRPAG